MCSDLAGNNTYLLTYLPRVDYRVPLAVCSYAPSDRDATVVAGSGTRMLKMRNAPVQGQGGDEPDI